MWHERPLLRLSDGWKICPSLHARIASEDVARRTRRDEGAVEGVISRCLSSKGVSKVGLGWGNNLIPTSRVLSLKL